MLVGLLDKNPKSFIHVLAMDDYTHDILKLSPFRHQLNLIRLNEIEDYEGQLIKVKSQRTIAEYCWTLTPIIMKYVLDSNPLVQRLTYLDSDLYFFNDYNDILEEINATSIAIIEHRYPVKLSYMSVAGRFNVEWVTFTRHRDAVNCLGRWYVQCLDWCYAVAADGKFGDQRYLDDWPILYKNIVVIQNVGAGVAPWNYSNYNIHEYKGKLMVDEWPLIFYHFHQYKITRKLYAFYMSRAYSRQGNMPIPIYRIYDAAITKSIAEICSIDPSFDYGYDSFSILIFRRFLQGYISPKIKEILKVRFRYLYRKL